jgi:hypothetical protein
VHERLELSANKNQIKVIEYRVLHCSKTQYVIEFGVDGKNMKIIGLADGD